jgi:hypothetical protein
VVEGASSLALVVRLDRPLASVVAPRARQAVGICGDDEDEGTVHGAAVGMSLG